MDGTHNNDAVEIQWVEKINKFREKKKYFLIILKTNVYVKIFDCLKFPCKSMYFS